MSPPITFAQASTPTDQPTFRAQTLALLANPPAPFQPAPVAGWSPSAPQRILVEEFSAEMAGESSLRAKVASTISPQTAVASGPDWVAAALGWFDETFIPALPAFWDVPFQALPADAPLTVGASSVIQIQATGGAIFMLAQATDVLFSAAGSYQGTLRFVARLPGTGGNVAGSSVLAGKILTAPAGLSLGPGTPSLFTAGRDVETPQQAITRCLGKWARLGAGWTRQAFDYLIPLLSPTITRWRVDDSGPYGGGTVGVILADAAGPATDPEVALVQNGLAAPNVRPLGSGGVTATKAAADALTVNVTVQGDGSNASLSANISSAGLALAGAFPIGPATLDNVLVEGVLLGGGYGSIKIAGAPGEIITITPALPGFPGAVKITAIDLVAPHVAPSGSVLELTLNVTVI